MQQYLSTARDVYARASNGVDMNNKMIQPFPDYDQQKWFLFPQPRWRIEAEPKEEEMTIRGLLILAGIVAAMFLFPGYLSPTGASHSVP
jgi:hypothetical protein